MPIPSRDQLRGLLDDALHGGDPPDHLAEWFDVIRAGNTARNRLDRFGRLFEVQHYLRILQQRHPTVLPGNMGRIELAVGQSLGLSAESIHADLIEIRRRLGDAWLERACPM
jgi:hypothetical protein